MASLQLPLADSTASPKQISSDYYYRIPVRTKIQRRTEIAVRFVL
jgi:hypothetical protein